MCFCISFCKELFTYEQVVTSVDVHDNGALCWTCGKLDRVKMSIGPSESSIPYFAFLFICWSALLLFNLSNNQASVTQFVVGDVCQIYFSLGDVGCELLSNLYLCKRIYNQRP